MRLTCPSCAVTYEVDPGLIAPGGQHVQCSACQTRWFARAPALAAPAETVSEDDIIARLEARPRPRPVPSPPVLRAVGPEQGPPARAPLAGADFLWHEPAGARGTGAERPYLRVVEPPAAEEPAAREAPVVEPAPVAAAGRPRLDLDPPRAPEPAPVPAPAPRRFWPGVVTGLALAALMVEVYLLADPIGTALPSAAPWLEAYADAVDSGRAWLEARLGPEVEGLRAAFGSG